MDNNQYLEWEITANKIKENNLKLLEEFEQWLAEKKLAVKSITKHKKNIEFYINDFLLRSEVIKAEEGAFAISAFLGDFFIQKTTWSSPNAIKENIASFKKFYTFLVETERTSAKDLSDMLARIKEESSEWIKFAERY